MYLPHCFRAGCLSMSIACCVFLSTSHAEERELTRLLEQFQNYSGATLVFQRDDLPEGRYHDVLKPLDETRCIEAAEICLTEAKSYPRGYFARTGLKSIGIFAACASKTTTDTSRTFDRQLGGYRYFGVYNGRDAIAAAFYSNGQLALTFHHEIFHHVDSTVAGTTSAWQLSSDDAIYDAAISGRQPYTAPPIRSEDVEQLRQKCIGYTLNDVVSEYAAKNPREDQAETARHVMSMLPNSLVQTIEQPELPGSQRILHVLKEYEQSVHDGPSFDWFVDVALGRTEELASVESPQWLIDQLRKLCKQADSGAVIQPHEGRRLLQQAVRLPANSLSLQQSNELIPLSAKLTRSLIRQRIQPDKQEQQFNIWGREDRSGANHTLRHDLAQFGRDMQRLGWIVQLHQQAESNKVEDASTQTMLENLRLLARYRSFVQKYFSLSDETDRVFDVSRLMMLTAAGLAQAGTAQPMQTATLQTASWQQLAELKWTATR